MKLLGYDITRKGVKKTPAFNLQKQFIDLIGSKDRPALGQEDIFKKFINSFANIPENYLSLYHTVYYSDILRLVITERVKEVFRNGFEWKPVCLSKCENKACAKEFDHKTEKCDDCGSPTKEPKWQEISKTAELFKNQINANGQTIAQVLKMTEFDAGVTDNAYLIALKTYDVNAAGEIVGAQVDEIVRASPSVMRIIQDSQGRFGYDDKGRKIRFCVFHRSSATAGDNCQVCGRPTLAAHYMAISGSGSNAKTEMYYSGDEVKHYSPYIPSLGYGFSPVITLFQKVSVLLAQDYLMATMYTEMRQASGALFINTTNSESFQRELKAQKEQLEMNPHHMMTFAVENDGKSGPPAVFIPFMPNFTEMQFIEGREELRKAVGAIYGVMPVMMGDVSASGGLNNEGLQFTVLNRAIAHAQSIYNDDVMPWILKQYGVTNWKYCLKPSEEQDEMAEKQRKQLDWQIAETAQRMGFEPVLNERGEFEFPKKATKKDESFAEGADVGDKEPEQKREGAPDDDVSKAYESEIFEIAKRGLTDEEIRFIEENIFTRKFHGLTKAQSDQIKKLLVESIYTKPSIETVINRIKGIVGDVITYEDIEKIVRTENQAIRLKLLEYDFKKRDPEGVFKYRWQGPQDARTTPICEAIKRRTSGGVKLEDLKKIIEEESQKVLKDFEVRDFVPHYMCRHRYTRVQ